MRVGAIPNPRKEITVKGTEEEVSNWLYKIPIYMHTHIKSGYIQQKLDEQIGRIEIGKTEFLSLGVNIIIDVNYKSEEATELCIEVQRTVGSFDRSAEISYANDHLNNTVQAIKYISKNKEYNPERKINSVSNSSIDKSNEDSSLVSGLVVFSILVILVFVFYILTM